MSRIFRTEALDATFDPRSGRALKTWMPTWGNVLLLCGCLLLALVIGLTQISYHQKVATRGTLVPIGGITHLAATSSGLVLELHAEQGDPIEKGDLIAVLAPNGTNRTTESDLLLQRQTWIREAEEVRKQSDEAYRQSQIRQSALVVKQARLIEELASIRREHTLLLEQIRLSQQELARWKSVAAKGLVAQQHVATREIETLELLQRAETVRREISLGERTISATEVEKIALEAEARTYRREQTSQAAALDLRVSAIDAAGRIEVVSPRSGTISSLNFEPGQTVAIGETIAAVADNSEVAEAEVWVTSSTPGDISVGSRCLARIDAFPYQSHGQMDCHVLTIAKTPRPQHGGAELPAYRATVQLDDSKQMRDIRGRLKPGMTVSVDIILEERRLVDWLTAPLRAARARLSNG